MKPDREMGTVYVVKGVEQVDRELESTFRAKVVVWKWIVHGNISLLKNEQKNQAF